MPEDIFKLVTVENCIKIAEKLNFTIFDNKPNIWGVRVPKGTGFNDLFIIFWRELAATPSGNELAWKSIITYGTTEPSPTYIQNLLKLGGRNPNGIAVMIADRQYIDCWIFGKHKGRYDALVNYWKFHFPCYRKKKDEILYYDGIVYYDAAGINFHTTRLGYYMDKILGWSEGCQVVFAAKVYFDKIIPYFSNYKNSKFSYTLVNDFQFYNLPIL